VAEGAATFTTGGGFSVDCVEGSGVSFLGDTSILRVTNSFVSCFATAYIHATL